MKITAYRITKAAYAPGIWSGTGARDFGGRWNSKGVAVIYTAENRSLAALEQLVHLIQPRLLKGYVIASIAFDSSHVHRLTEFNLPADWNNPVAPPSLKTIGDNWIAAGTHPVLAVPSAVMHGELNYMINPAHTEFKRMATSTPMPFAYDDRMK